MLNVYSKISQLRVRQFVRIAYSAAAIGGSEAVLRPRVSAAMTRARWTPAGYPSAARKISTTSIGVVFSTGFNPASAKDLHHALCVIYKVIVAMYGEQIGEIVDYIIQNFPMDVIEYSLNSVKVAAAGFGMMLIKRVADQLPLGYIHKLIDELKKRGYPNISDWMQRSFFGGQGSGGRGGSSGGGGGGSGDGDAGDGGRKSGAGAGDGGGGRVDINIAVNIKDCVLVVISD